MADFPWVACEYLLPGVLLGTVTNQVILRCPKHGHALLGNGQVQPSPDNRPAAPVLPKR